MITHSYKELSVVSVFQSYTPVDFAQLLGQASGGVGKRLENTHHRRNIGGEIGGVLRRRNQQLVDIAGHRNGIVAVEWIFHAESQTKIGRNEIRSVVGVVRYFGTDVGYVETESPETLLTSEIYGPAIETADICGEGVPGRIVTTHQIGINIAQGNRHGIILRKHTGISHIQSHLVRLYGITLIAQGLP
ncbi:MAG: hypothetical protein BWX77_00872 [Bacteroidetes bacterium ADurb.Bin090]|nr:MAG: hypothetical protein BWX77_00872 [Bacteroidetes bacterium ADurb.Bin090]